MLKYPDHYLTDRTAHAVLSAIRIRRVQTRLSALTSGSAAWIHDQQVLLGGAHANISAIEHGEESC